MSAPRRIAYATAFHKQALSDWELYELLSRSQPSPAKCHTLHYLQMACEKLGKAYRLLHPAADVDVIATRHVGFQQFVNEHLRSPAVMLKYKGRLAQHKVICHELASIAREVEKLAPAVDRTFAPENAEYPWERGDWATGTGQVLVPCMYSYPALSLLTTMSGSAFLKMVREALHYWKPPS